MAEKRVTVTNHQGYSWNIEPIDLARWAKRGYFPEKEKKKKKEKSKE